MHSDVVTSAHCVELEGAPAYDALFIRDTTHWLELLDGLLGHMMEWTATKFNRTAELRIKARVAQESLEAVRSYMRVTEEAAVQGVDVATYVAGVKTPSA